MFLSLFCLLERGDGFFYPPLHQCVRDVLVLCLTTVLEPFLQFDALEHLQKIRVFL